MNRKILASAFLSLGIMFTSCNNDDDNTVTEKSYNLDLSINGLENLGNDYVYEGWIIVNDAPVTTGVFTVDDNGTWSQKSFWVDQTALGTATAFVLTIEPADDSDPAPSATKLLVAPFANNTATVAANTIPGINTSGDGVFTTAAGKYFLRTPTDETGDNNMNDENGIWFGTPGAPPTAGFSGMPELDMDSGWRYEGWVVVDGTPISTGTFTSFSDRDSGNPFSGTEANAGPPVPGEDFFLNAPDGVTFPLDVRGKTAVISIEPYPDNSAAPFAIKPLVSQIAMDADTAPTAHDFGANLTSFPTGTITRK
ncbi:anti-sigma factor [Wenyingzhuangia sp. IMCC45574]